MTASAPQSSLKEQWDAPSLAMLEELQDKIPAIKKLIVDNQKTAQGWHYEASLWYQVFLSQEEAFGRPLTTRDYYDVFDELHMAFERVESKGALYLEEKLEIFKSLCRDLSRLGLKAPVSRVVTALLQDIEQGLIRLQSFDDRKDGARCYLEGVLVAYADTDRPANYTYAEDIPSSNKALTQHRKGWTDQVCDMTCEAAQAIKFFDEAARNLINLGTYIDSLQPQDAAEQPLKSRKPHSKPTTVEQLARHL